MNEVHLFGFVGNPPKRKETTKNNVSTTFSLAVRIEFGSDRINWVQCICYGPLAELVYSNFGKGDPMLVERGELVSWTWVDKKDGNMHSIHRVRVRRIRNMRFLDRKDEVIYEESKDGSDNEDA